MAQTGTGFCSTGLARGRALRIWPGMRRGWRSAQYGALDRGVLRTSRWLRRTRPRDGRFTCGRSMARRGFCMTRGRWWGCPCAGGRRSGPWFSCDAGGLGSALCDREVLPKALRRELCHAVAFHLRDGQAVYVCAGGLDRPCASPGSSVCSRSDLMFDDSLWTPPFGAAFSSRSAMSRLSGRF